MTAYETVSAGSKGTANLLRAHFNFWSLQAPDEESDEVIIHRIHIFQSIRFSSTIVDEHNTTFQ